MKRIYIPALAAALCLLILALFLTVCREKNKIVTGYTNQRKPAQANPAVRKWKKLDYASMLKNKPDTIPSPLIASILFPPPRFALPFVGTWTDGNDGEEGLFAITYEDNKFKVKNCCASSDKGVYYFCRYENETLFITGYDDSCFYKYEIPSFQPVEGKLIYSDGAGSIELRRSDVSINSKPRAYELLDPVNND